ncbi:hypothetical protein TNCV_3071751 [Trichonephila clavipes]|nr:hypothetical protein TNCV_3071751 [Trichonephila clavipes]
MKSLVYDTPVYNAEELVARIAVAAGEIRNSPGVFQNVRMSMRRRSAERFRRRPRKRWACWSSTKGSGKTNNIIAVVACQFYAYNALLGDERLLEYWFVDYELSDKAVVPKMVPKDPRGARAPEGKRLDFEGAVVRSLQRGGKTLVSSRSTAASELGRSGNGLSPDQR